MACTLCFLQIMSQNETLSPAAIPDQNKPPAYKSLLIFFPLSLASGRVHFFKRKHTHLEEREVLCFTNLSFPSFVATLKLFPFLGGGEEVEEPRYEAPHTKNKTTMVRGGIGG